MFSTKLIAAAAASLSLMSSVTADYNPASQANVAMYYGSGDNQLPLAHFCDSTSVDIIPIGFVNIFPNLANGLVAQNFGNQCWNDGNYTGPGYNGAVNSKNDFLYKRCPQLQEDIYYCQTKTKKKILLSLGGDGGDYKLNGEADGKYLAEFLWGAYGPYDDAWVAKGGVRPLDRGLYNTNASMTIDVDGFDFDIERKSPDEQVGYIACIKRLRQLFDAYKLKNKCSKTYLISGAPQCPLPEQNMGLTIAAAKFDILFIQFYNNAGNGCNARNWTSGPNKATFNYNKWVDTIKGGASKDAKLYIGLLGSTSAGNSNDYLSALESKALIDAWHGAPQFGGVMIWEATYAENNRPSSFPGRNYHQVIKEVLNPYAPATTAPAAVCSTTVSSSSRSSTSTFKTSSSTKISTTSSTVQSSSTSKPASSTASPTSSKITSSSSSKVSSSTVKPTSSSSLVSSSSTVKPTSSSTVLSSSSSVITSSSILTTQTSAGVVTTSSTTSSSAAPVATECVYKGCYTEATNMRALSEKTLFEEYTMTIELCAEFCSGYAFYGLEYAKECYCGNKLNAGSVLALDADTECDFACSGNGDQGCGGSNRLDVYECPAAPTTSSSSSSLVSTSSSISVSETSSSASSTSSVVSTSSIVSISISDSSSSTASSTSSSPSSSVVSTSSIVSITISESPSSSSTVSVTTSSAVSTSSIVSISISESSSTVSETSTSQSSSSGKPSSTSSAETFMTPTFSQTFSYDSTITSSSSVVTPTLSSSSSSEVETTKSSSSIGLTSSTQSGPVTSSSHVSSSSSSTHYSNTSTSAGTTKSASSTGVTSLPTSSKSSGGAVTYPPKPTTSSTTEYTTSTVCTTRVETITACPPSVTNCPVGSVTTKTIPLYTTVCPVTETKTPIGKPTTTPIPTYKPTGPVTKHTTSTVYTTSVYTITSCAPSVTDCPSKLGHVTTEIIKLYTTVCPVTENPKPTPSTYSPVSPIVEQPAFTGKAIPPHYDSDSTTTLSSTTTQYKTIKIVKSTATIVPVPYTTLAPYPTGPAGPGAGYPVGSGTAAPSAVAVTSSAEGADETKTPVPVYATGSASSSRSAVGVMVAVAAGVVAFML